MNAQAINNEILYTKDECVSRVEERWKDRRIDAFIDKLGTIQFQSSMTILAIAKMEVPLPKQLYVLHFYEPFTQVVRHDVNQDRQFLPTLPDLVDRLTIVQQKMIFIPERAEEYTEERAHLIHDIDMLLKNGTAMSGKALAAVVLIMLTNRVIWENESLARKGGSEQDKMLKFTHSINGVRNNAKNVLAAEMGGRHDYKVDCFAGEFGDNYGNWNVFEKL